MSQQDNRGKANRTSSPNARARNTSRVSSVTVTRTPVIDDDPALNAIMSNIFAPSTAQGRSCGRGGLDATNATNLSNLDYSKFEQGRKNSQMESTQMPGGKDPKFAMQDDLDGDGEVERPCEEKDDSIIEWFDKAVENQLRKRRDNVVAEATCGVKKALKTPEDKYGLKMSQLAFDKLSEAAAEGKISVPVQLEMEPDTELTDAVDKLAKAEAMCAFAAAVQAAEQAAENAPPELAEEAAAMGAARGFTTEATVVKEVMPGDRPIEVVGYVGITRPKDPKRSM